MEPTKADQPESLWRAFAPLLLIAQSLAVLAWWGLMLSRPELRPSFVPGPHELMFALMAPDLLLLVGAGLFAAQLLRKNSRWGFPALMLHLGAIGYAAVFTVSLYGQYGTGWLGAYCMLGSLSITSLLAWQVRP